jgi:hypothetical protein
LNLSPRGIVEPSSIRFLASYPTLCAKNLVPSYGADSMGLLKMIGLRDKR